MCCFAALAAAGREGVQRQGIDDMWCGAQTHRARYAGRGGPGRCASHRGSAFGGLRLRQGLRDLARPYPNPADTASLG